MLEAATKVLKELQRNDIVEVGAVKQPTNNVVLAMELSCHMFELRPKKEMIGRVSNDPHGFFECARQNLLSKAQVFLDKMINYEKEKIPEPVVKKANKVLSTDGFTYDTVMSSSKALGGIYLSLIHI